MKKIALLISGLSLAFALNSNAQSAVTGTTPTFHVGDTVYATVTGAATVHDDITNTYSDSVRVQWHVIYSDLPADWYPTGSLTTSVGMCDNNLCYGFSSLYPSMATRLSGKYAMAPGGDFHMLLNLTGATTMGTHYVTLRLVSVNKNTYVPIDSTTTTYAITKAPVSVPVVSNGSEEIIIYPNPAREELNVVFDANSDVKTIAIYNIIGKVVSVFKVNGNSANLSLDNMPGGIYVVRLVNGEGAVVGTRKFTKQ
jgi:hypothetical protein